MLKWPDGMCRHYLHFVENFLRATII